MDKKTLHLKPGKPLQFDKNQVLYKAMKVFWEYGYEKTSISMLETSTHLSRSSITNTFKNKRGLYEASLEAYQKFVFESLIIPLRNQKKTAREALVEFFQNLFFLNSGEYCGKGCLILNTAGEFGGQDSYMKNLIEENIQALENEFISLIYRTKTDFSLTNIPQNAPQILVSFFITLHTISKTFGEEKILKNYLKVSISVIESWK